MDYYIDDVVRDGEEEEDSEEEHPCSPQLGRIFRRKYNPRPVRWALLGHGNLAKVYRYWYMAWAIQHSHKRHCQTQCHNYISV